MAFRIPLSLLTTEQKLRIKKELTVIKTVKPWIQKNTFKKPQEITFYQIVNETNEILLPLYTASQIFGQKFLNKRKTFRQIAPFYMKTELRDYQKAVMKTAFEHYNDTGSVFFNVFCAFGKTVVASYAASVFSQQFRLRTLVIYHLIFIEKSWIGTFANLTTAQVYVVGQTQGPTTDDHQVILSMEGRVHHIPPHILASIGHVVFDEAHTFCTDKKVPVLLCTEPLYVTMLTATKARDDGFDIMLDLLAGSKRITKISTKPFFVIKIPTSFEIEVKKTARGVDWSDLIDKFDSIPERNTLIFNIVMNNLHQKILIAFKHVDSAKRFHAWLSEVLPRYGCTCALLAGNAKSYEDANVIVATVAKCGIGFDERESATNFNGKRINMLILPNSILNNEQIYGRAGRADMSVIVEFADKNKNIKSHLNKKRKWTESRGGIILELKENEVFCWEQIKERMISTYVNRDKIVIEESAEDEKFESGYGNDSEAGEESGISAVCSSQEYLSRVAARFAK